jgi:hypothetical protein
MWYIVKLVQTFWSDNHTLLLKRATKKTLATRGCLAGSNHLSTWTHAPFQFQGRRAGGIPWWLLLANTKFWLIKLRQTALFPAWSGRIQRPIVAIDESELDSGWQTILPATTRHGRRWSLSYAYHPSRAWGSSCSCGPLWPPNPRSRLSHGSAQDGGWLNFVQINSN